MNLVVALRWGWKRRRPRHSTRPPPLVADVRAITQHLQVDGIAAFASSFEQLIATVGMKRPELSLNRCIALAHEERVALMCAEAVPWRCHRSLIADALLVRGVEVGEITSAMHVRPYSLTSWARISGVDVTYPSAGFGTEEIISARIGNGRPVKEKHA